MRASQLVRKAVTIVLVVYFASRIIASYVKLQKRNIGTLFNRIVSDTVQGGDSSLNVKDIFLCCPEMFNEFICT